MPKHIDTTTRSPTNVASVEQFLRGSGGDCSRMSPTYSPTSNSPSSPYSDKMKHQDQEEDHGLNQKKSVLNKVKEKAKKLCSSLSKRRMEDENVTPSWGVKLEDDEQEEDDAEYLGAPMYESELAPDAYKENARQHPRANPVISENHVLHNTVRLEGQHDREKPRATMNLKCTSTTQPDNTTTKTKNLTPNMASETLAQKQMPAYAGGSLAANSISSKNQVAVSKNHLTTNSMPSRNTSVSPSQMQNSLSSSASHSGKNSSQNGASVKDYLMSKSELENDAKTLSPMQDLSSSSASLSGKITQRCASAKYYSMNRSEQVDDARTMTPLQKSSSLSASSLRGRNTTQRSASAKDYSMGKSEPRDDEKTASRLQMISEGTGPKRTSSNAGMMEKVRGAVNSFLGNEDSSQEYGVNCPTTRTSSQTQQVGQDENRGRILQAN
ncbi:unnamed protein product [Sphenostylis stenocarpa]|uniref:LTI65/LTI78 N-terminal domain-containing protein n=1 Tax=Sphenostylis stenocarpa TaxID=92480 RepID=A0AA86SEK1_9FABA|nr:unnamed protein product [Sphenostylis stenocarpa]